MNTVSCGFEHGPHKGNRRALAIGARDMNHGGQAFMRVTEPGEKGEKIIPDRKIPAPGAFAGEERIKPRFKIRWQ